MAVRWPDGSVTGSVRVETPVPALVEEPEPEKQPEKDNKKEVGHADR